MTLTLILRQTLTPNSHPNANPNADIPSGHLTLDETETSAYLSTECQSLYDVEIEHNTKEE